MTKTISKIVLTLFIMTPYVAFAAGDEAVTTKGYVDSGLTQKANRAAAGDAGKIAIINAKGDYDGQTATQLNLVTGTDLAGYETVAEAAEKYETKGAAATVQTNLDTFTNRAEGFATAAQGTAATTAATDAATALSTATAANTAATQAQTAADAAKLVTDSITTNDTVAKANSALQAGALTNYMQKHNCTAGQMMLTAADGAVSCIDIENGTYTEI